MPVRIEHRVHAPDPGAQCLLAKVGAGIDHHHPLNPSVCFTPAQYRRRPQPSVVRIGRGADSARTPQRWNSHRGSRTEKCQQALHNLSQKQARRLRSSEPLFPIPCSLFPAFSLLPRRGWRRRLHCLHVDHAGQFQEGHARLKQHCLQRAILGLGQVALGLLGQNAQ